MRRLLAKLMFLLLWLAACASTASAAPCGGDFASWLQGVKQEAATHGISQRTIQSALESVAYDPGVIARDHAQGVFRQSFEQFSGRMVPPRMGRGRRMMQQYGAVLSRIEQQYGVPGAVIVAIWGLETDFGADNGRFPTIRSLASLAYDCRRPDKFRDELIAALQIVERGDMSPAEMRGAWAGEIGQTQFLPSSYLKYAAGRRAGLHCQLSERLWLAARSIVGRRQRQFPGAAAMECIAGLHQDHRLFRATACRRGGVTSARSTVTISTKSHPAL
jgi:membrane-bound lytic murein transglycosylase B